MRLRLTVAYDGSAFSGWQSQQHGGGAQDCLERALAKILKQPLRIHGAGRTDAGVHALGQVAHLDLPPGTSLTREEWLRALNVNLPPTLRVLRAVPAPADFHARFSAKGKSYRYRLIQQPVLPPLEFRRAWHLPLPLDFNRLEEAVHLFRGRHDFIGFAANRRSKPTSTVRTITDTRIRRSPGGVISMDFSGDGFLYKMVRALVAGAVGVAQGKWDLGEIRRKLKHPAPPLNLPIAPADGLYLLKVRY